jgi:hypothetical protein
VVRASVSQIRAADKAVLNIVHKKKKIQKIPRLILLVPFANFSIGWTGA